MSRTLFTQPVISRVDLEQIGKERLLEAGVLLEAGHSAGAVYLGGYAVECYLKAAICHCLKWDQLLGVFKTHDLGGLLVYTGLEQKLRKEVSVHRNFSRIVGIWNGSGAEAKSRSADAAVRYQPPSAIEKATAQEFMVCLSGATGGFIPWLQKATS